MSVEERTYDICGYGELPPAVDPHQPEPAQGIDDEVAFQESAVIAEKEMVRTGNRNKRPRVGRQAIVHGLDILEDFLRFLAVFAAVITEQDEEWLFDRHVRRVGEHPAVDVDAGTTAR